NGACTSFSFTVPTSTCSTSHSCTPHIGVVFALAGDASQLTNSMTTACAGSLVTCLDPNPSLLHVQQWSDQHTTGTAGAPNVGSVTLQNLAGQAGVTSPCGDGYFSDAGGACRIGVAAKLYLGSNPNPTGVSVLAKVGGGSFTPLCYQTAGQYAGSWTTD